MEKQPARVNYFFGKGYRDFAHSIQNTFVLCGKVILNSWENVCDAAEDLWDDVLEVISGEVFTFFHGIGMSFKLGLNLGRLIMSIILMPLLSIIISLMQAVILVSVMPIVYLGYSFVALLDKVYRGFKRISTNCPSCQEKYDLPTYVCTCGAQHTRLVPSKYGIFTRTCECGEKLKTTFFNGRHKLPGQWQCPDCGYTLSGAFQTDISIPVVGGASSGKTCFINMAISQIEKNASAQYGLEFKYQPNENLDDDYERNKAVMARGGVPDSTSETRLKYYQFYLTPKGEKLKNLISLCDVAGEAYNSTASVGGQVGFKYANAFLMVIDPLSIEKYRSAVEKKIDISKHGGSVMPMDEVLDVLINTLENLNCLNSKNMMSTDVAVVFTKCDIYGLPNYFGDDAISRYMKAKNIRSKYEATNAVCEHFLLRCGERNFLNSLKSKFKSIQFFTCSALGHVANNGEAFTPIGVEEPVLWLIDKASASIDLKEKWGKRI